MELWQWLMDLRSATNDGSLWCFWNFVPITAFSGILRTVTMLQNCPVELRKPVKNAWNFQNGQEFSAVHHDHAFSKLKSSLQRWILNDVDCYFWGLFRCIRTSPTILPCISDFIYIKHRSSVRFFRAKCVSLIFKL